MRESLILSSPHTAFSLLCLAILAAGSIRSTAQDAAALSPEAMKKLTGELEANLDQQILAPWYPRAVDKTHGGFSEGYDEQWRPSGSPTQRSIVYQSRLTWVAAEVAHRYPSRAPEYRQYALHGLRALKDLMWDKELGGFYWQVDAATGRPTASSAEKHAYGNSFGIYAAAAVYGTTKDPTALDLAKRAFNWLDERAHDAKNGGYFEALTREGKPILAPPAPGRRDFIGTVYGFKSMNSHIHLLEAFTELHRVWPDPKVKARLDEVFRIVRDRVYVDPGCLHLFFNPDWRPVPDHDSFGHDIETAYLLIESADELGLPDDPATLRASRMLVNHALEVGWDAKNGGFYDLGTTFGPATHLDKVWWTQAEGLNALLLVYAEVQRNHGPDLGVIPLKPDVYLDAFNKQWAFIRDHQIDAQNKGWISAVGPDGKVASGQSKSDMWKDPYHQGRAVMNVLAQLRKLKGR